MTRDRAAGVALFSGEHASVSLARAPGESSLQVGSAGGPISEWSRVPAFRTTAIAHPSGGRVACVEHLFAALAAFGAHDGVAITVTGAELPILDGAAAAWCALLDRLGVDGAPPRLRVVRAGAIALGSSNYLFSPSETSIDVAVEIDLAAAGPFARTLPTRASWTGIRSDFVSRIASARTFLAATELGEFEKQNAAAHLPQSSFVILGDSGAITEGAPFNADEPARHKLLDLVGDFFLWGGPAIGRMEAVRPGHAKNHEAIAKALNEGILARI